MSDTPSLLKCALAGNPNSGKSSVFNALTGARQKIGNWPGVTVEKKESIIPTRRGQIHLTDLPGIYSLTPRSIEENIAFRHILEDKPDLIINVVDAKNLDRNLYLTAQLLETGIPLLLILNMIDRAEAAEVNIDIPALSLLLGVPVIASSARSGRGISDIEFWLTEAISSPAMLSRRQIDIPYSRDIEAALTSLTALISDGEFPLTQRWTAIQLLEDNDTARKYLPADSPLLDAASGQRKHLMAHQQQEPGRQFTAGRYAFIAGLITETVRQKNTQNLSSSQKLDRILTHKYLGIPIFLLLLWLTFKLTFEGGQWPMQLIDMGFHKLSGLASALLPAGTFRELITDGLITGIGSIAVFIPNIFILFFLISFMEDSGYMARGAFIMDRVMHSIGLHGKAFIPMIMGFGCNVPAIIGTRILESERDRRLSILINPLISCSARLPVYILLTGAFFPRHGAAVILSIYVISISLAVLIGRLFSRTLFKGDSLPFVMELPPYLPPSPSLLLRHTWERVSLFIRKMGTVILAGSVIIWALSAFPRHVPAQQELDAHLQTLKQSGAKNISDTADSPNAAELEKEYRPQIVEQRFLGRIGKSLEPVMAPISLDWRESVSLLVGFVAKEFVVSTFAILYGHEDDGKGQNTGLVSRLQQGALTPLRAFVFMIFTLIYTPCLATVAAIRQETGSWKWAGFSIAYSLILAWLLSFVIYQTGLFFIGRI